MVLYPGDPQPNRTVNRGSRDPDNNRYVNPNAGLDNPAVDDYVGRRINDPIKKEIDQVNNTFSPRSRLKYPLEKQDLYQGQILFTPIITTPPRIQGGGFKALKEHIMRPQEEIIKELEGSEEAGSKGLTGTNIKDQSQSREFVDDTTFETDLIAQQKFLNEKFIKEEDPPTSGGGEEEKPAEPQKLKIDIPETPFEVDIQQVKDQLKKILKQWEIKQYMSDKHRWKEYYKDIAKLLKTIEGDK